MSNLYRATKAHAIFLVELGAFLDKLKISEVTQILDLNELLANLHKIRGSADLFGYQEITKVIKNFENQINADSSNEHKALDLIGQLNVYESIETLLQENK